MRLQREGKDLKLRNQAFLVLQVLVDRHGKYVPYEQLLREAWGGTAVSRHTVASTVAEVRKTLVEFGSWIGYRPKLGYRMEIPRTDELIRTGWHLYSRRTREGFEKALETFQRAAAEDASDPAAYEGSSRCFLMLGFYGMRLPGDTYPRFLEDHTHAVAFSGLTPELRSDRAQGLHVFERRLAEAEAELLAVHGEKVFATNCIRLALLYAAHQRFEEAATFIEQARQTDKLSPTLPATEIFFWLARHDYEKAVECGKQGVELHPYQPLLRSYYAQALEFAGAVEKAFEQYRLACVVSPDIPWLCALEAGCFARHGRRAESLQAMAALEQLRREIYVDAYYMAVLQEGLGHRDAAFEELSRGERENSAALYMLKVDPKVDSLRGDARFIELAARLFPDSQFPSTRKR